MIAGKPPFRCETISELYAQIKGVKYVCPDTFSEELRGLLRKVLVRDPSKRATMDVVRADEWVNDGEPGPPVRVAPKVSIDSRKAGATKNLDTFVSHIEKEDGFIVYNFGHDLRVDFDVDENQSTETAVFPPQGTRDDIPAIVGEKPAGAAHPPQVRARRFSLTSAIGKMMPFQKDKVEEEDAPVTVTNRTNTQPPTPVMMPVSQINTGRRHSVAVDVTVAERVNMVPNSKSPTASGMQSLNPSNASSSANAASSMEQINEEGITPSNQHIAVPSSKSRRMSRTSQTTAGSHERRMSISNNDAEYFEDIRAVRFGLNMIMKQSKSQVEVITLVERMVTELNLKCERRGRFTFICSEDHPMGNVTVEVEVCKVWLLNVFGVRIKRLNGDAFGYKTVYDKMQHYLKV
jgi:serine/threonine protein kinase